jgi:hypothetical protein
MAAPAQFFAVEDSSEGNGTIHVALDESFSPLLCVGAAVSETEFSTINRDIVSLYEETKQFSWLDDVTSFQKFVADGFHLSNDDQTITDRFMQFLGHSVGYSAYVFYTESDRLGRQKATLWLYRELVRTILQKYRTRPLIKFYFEQNNELDTYFRGVVDLCMKSVRRPKPAVEVHIRPKMEPPLLSVCDYSMLTFARWYKGYANCPAATTSASHFTWRNFNAIRRSYAVIRSSESGNLSQRDLPFSEVLI